MKQDLSNEDLKWTKDTLTCRHIVSEVVKFGVNEEQKLKIIELLALELENRENSIAIVQAAKGIAEVAQTKINSGRILT